MSIVAVHGPNTMFTTEGGGLSIPSSGGGIAQATKDVSNGLKFAFSVPNPGARPAADFDWTFTGPGSPAAQADKFSGTVTYTGAGAGTIVCTVAAGAGPPAGGTYTINVTATAGMPRSLPPGGDGGGDDGGEPSAFQSESSPEVAIAFDPAAHTVAEVEEYAGEHPDQAKEILDAEIAGKDRVTLVNYLQNLIPFDPGEHTVSDVEDYVTANPDELERVYSAEVDGKNRSTLISWLEGQGAT